MILMSGWIKKSRILMILMIMMILMSGWIKDLDDLGDLDLDERLDQGSRVLMILMIMMILMILMSSWIKDQGS